MSLITKAMREYAEKHCAIAAGAPEEVVKEALTVAVRHGKLSSGELDRLATVDKKIDAIFSGKVGQDADDVTTIRDVPASRSYSTTKSAILHPQTQRPMFDCHGRACQTVSALEYAKAGAFLKLLAKRGGQQLDLTDHDKQLLGEMFEKDAWCGEYQGQWVAGLQGARVKSLLNDSTSGGSSLVPEWFDADLVSYPLLHSELFPFIDLRPVPRGSSVEGGAVGNPSVQWGTAEGTEIGLFNTDDLVAAIAATIHPVTVAITVGRDFLSDSPADVGRVLMENINQSMAKELDNVIVNGNGTSQPQGIKNASGLATVNSDNAAAGPPTLNDYLALMFAVGKQYRNAAMRPVYISNDTTYRRSRNIKVDPAAPSTDQRPLFGVDNVQSYSTLQTPHKIQNDLSNALAIYGALTRYRMYRRMGASAEWTTEGASLKLSNEALLIVRARYGGKVVDASAFAKCSDMQS